MKTSKIETEMTSENILVMFPSAKNFPVKESLSDSLNELLNEYSHISEDQIPGYISNEDFDTDEDSLGFDSLDAFMNRNQNSEVLSPDDKLVNLINQRLDAIVELKAKIKFYLDEIEMFMPAKREKM